jgi:hypothetical protein
MAWAAYQAYLVDRSVRIAVGLASSEDRQGMASLVLALASCLRVDRILAWEGSTWADPCSLAEPYHRKRTAFAGWHAEPFAIQELVDGCPFAERAQRKEAWYRSSCRSSRRQLWSPRREKSSRRNRSSTVRAAGPWVTYLGDALVILHDSAAGDGSEWVELGSKTVVIPLVCRQCRRYHDSPSKFLT